MLAHVTSSFYAFGRWFTETITHPSVAGTVQLAGARYLAALIRLGTTAFAARLLGPADYGTVALALAYPALVLAIGATKCEPIIIRYIATFRAEGRNAELLGVCKLGYLVEFSAAVLSMVVVFWTAGWFATNVYDRPDLAWLMMVYAGSFPLLTLGGASSAILSSFREFRWLALLRVVHPLITLVSVVGFLSQGYGVPGMIFALTIGNAGIGLTFFAASIRALHRDGREHWWHGELARVVPLLREFGIVLAWHYIRHSALGVLESAPVMILGRYDTVEAAGFYKLATNIASVGRTVESAMTRVLYPTLSARVARAGFDGMRSLNAKMKDWTLRGGCPVAFLLLMTVLLLPVLVRWVFGEDYTPAIPSAQILLLGTAFSAIFFWTDVWYYAANRVDFVTKAYVGYVGVLMIVAWLSVASMGLIGLVIVLAIGRVTFAAAMAANALWRA